MTDRVLVTGAAGLVGSWVVASAPAGVDVVGVVRADADLSDAWAVRALFDRVQPSVVIHTAFSFRDLAGDVVSATENVATACAAAGAALIHLSTDALFSGADAPYAESAVPDPVNAYGRAKTEAEAAVRSLLPDACIVRTSLVCWHEPPDPRTAWVLDDVGRGVPITLFTDEVRVPIRADDLAVQLWAIASLPASERAGIWHVVGAEAMNRVGLGTLIAEWAGLDPAGITAGLSADFPGPEPRPTDCRLVCTRPVPGLDPPRSIRTLFPRPDTST